MSDNQPSPEQLAATVAKLKKGIRNTTIAVMVLALATLGYASYFFQFGYSEIQDLKDSDHLIALAKETLLTPYNYPDTLRGATDWVNSEVKKNAPELAQVASDNLKGLAPDARRLIEEYAMTEMDLLLTQGGAFSAEQFGNLVDTHKDEIKAAISDLSQNNDEALAKATIEALADAIGDELDADLQEEAAVVMGTLYQLNDKFERLALGQGLSEQEQDEREAIMLMKRVLIEHSDPSLAGKELPNQQPFVAAENTEG